MTAYSVQTGTAPQTQYLPPWMKAKPGEEAGNSDFIHRIGMWSALILIFLRFSFLHETFTYYTGVNTFVLYIFGPIALFSFALTGGIRRTFNERTGKYWLGFLACMALAVPFSSWAGGSTIHLYTYLRTDFPMLLVAAGIARTWTECRKMLLALCLAGLVNLATAHLLLHNEGGRMSLASEGMISNSNDLAAHLLLVLPFLLYYVIRPGTNIVIRVLLMAAIGNGLFQILRTASRGALVALVLTSIFVLIRGSARQRLVVAVGAPLAFLAVISMLPTATWQRLMSFGDNANASEEAMESTEARQYLLKQSLLFTLQHPVFGVGPGQFSSYEGSSATSQGEVGNWHETHNSYTQVSAECGIPAAIFYVLALGSTFAVLSRIRKHAILLKNQELAAATFCITVALVAYCVATFFISFAYHFQQLTISGLVMVIWTAVRNQRPSPDAAGTKTGLTAGWRAAGQRRSLPDANPSLLHASE